MSLHAPLFPGPLSINTHSHFSPFLFNLPSHAFFIIFCFLQTSKDNPLLMHAQYTLSSLLYTPSVWRNSPMPNPSIETDINGFLPVNFMTHSHICSLHPFIVKWIQEIQVNHFMFSTKTMVLVNGIYPLILLSSFSVFSLFLHVTWIKVMQCSHFEQKHGAGLRYFS